MGEAPHTHREKELEYLLSATLVPREKFLQLDGMQHCGDEQQHASRNKYYVRNADSASVVSACTAKLVKEPNNTAVLLIRASELLKTGAALTVLRSAQCALCGARALAAVHCGRRPVRSGLHRPRSGGCAGAKARPCALPEGRCAGQPGAAGRGHRGTILRD